MNFPQYLKNSLVSSFLVCHILIALIFTSKSYAEVAQTPPMGYNTFDYWGSRIPEAQVKAAVDYMATNLKQYGWNYFVIDYCWYYTGTGWPFPQDANWNPKVMLDEYGRVLPDPATYPSSVNGKGFKPIADYVHGKGLKFGIHLMRGIPRQAVAQNTPVKGTNYKAGDIYTKNDPCAWLNLQWPLNMSHPGAQAYLNSLFEQYASWDVDFVKIDDLVNPYGGSVAHEAEIIGYRKAIDSCGREMVFSSSPGPTLLPTASFDITKYVNQWRMVNDFWDKWTALNEEFDKAKSWYKYARPGHWPDADMIPIGRLSTGLSKFTTDEKYTVMNLFCIIRSPLIWGGNLVDNTPEDLKFMQNSEVLAVNQKSINNKPVDSTGNTQVWCADVPGTQIKYVGVFNRNDNPANVTIKFSSLGVTTASDTLRDLWTKTNLGVFSTSYTVNLAAHQSKLYRLTPPGEKMPNDSATSIHERKVSGATVAVRAGFEAGISYGRIVVRPNNEYRKFGISVFLPDGRLVVRKDGLSGTAAIPVERGHVYIIEVKCNGTNERFKVSCF